MKNVQLSKEQIDEIAEKTAQKLLELIKKEKDKEIRMKMHSLSQ
jgi:hypothetical protein